MNPHGIDVDHDGNLWITDYGDNAPRGPRGAPRGSAPAVAVTPATKGHQVFKFSPDGKLLLALGAVGGSRSEYFFQPNDVLVAPNGDIFVSHGHSDGGTILKFDRAGKLLMQFGKVPAPVNSMFHMHWPWTRRDVCSSATGETTAS